MAALARTEILERKIEKHMREHTDDMRNLKNELQILKIKPKISTYWDQRPLNDSTMKKAANNLKNENVQKMPTKSFKKKLETDGSSRGMILNDNHNFSAGEKVTNKMNLQHHPLEGEHIVVNNRIFRTDSSFTLNSSNTSTTAADSATTKINYNGSIVPSPVNSIKLLQFLMVELETKLKDYISEDDDEISKVLKDIKYAIKRVKIESRLSSEVLKNPMKDDSVISRVTSDKPNSSKESQTNLDGDEMEKLMNFQRNYLKTQLDMDENLRRMEELFTVELKKSDEKITKLSEYINSHEFKLRDELHDKNTTMSHQIDLKMEEIKGEMKFLVGMIGETKNRNLIDNLSKKLAQTQKKIDEVKRKCTETTKHCLQMHVENHLINSHASKTKQKMGLECELGQIKNEFSKQIHELKNAIMRNDSVLKYQNEMIESKSTTSLCSSSSSNSPKSEEFTTESIISSIKLNEKIYKMENCCVDKFNNVDNCDDDNFDDDNDYDEKDKYSMKADEKSLPSTIYYDFEQRHLTENQ